MSADGQDQPPARTARLVLVTPDGVGSVDAMSADGQDQPPARTARLVLVTPDGAVVGSLAPVPVATPWWQDIAPVVQAVHEHHGIDVTVLRLLEAERDHPPGGLVTYLAEVPQPVATEPWTGALSDHPLRLPYARPGGPIADLDWAHSVLAGRGIAGGHPEQVRMWNLSSLWSIPAGGATAWLKVVPPFFAHEGAVLEALASEHVPRLLGHDGPRVLLAGIPGEDQYDADLPELNAMVTMLVGLQRRWSDRIGALLALGLPDWRAVPLTAAIADVVDRTRPELAANDATVLDRFVGDLPRRFAAVSACGLPDTLVHGDFHPGNVRGSSGDLTLLDWGDSGVGHPLLDQPAFLERIPQAVAGSVRGHWARAWRGVVPESDPARALELLAPVAAARQAVIYRKFLDHIEPSERVYHRTDPALWLTRTAAILRDG